MARQKGIIKIKGKVGDLSFYKTQDGHLVREKGGVDASRIASDPAFVRTRENGAEFGSSAMSGKLVRSTLRPLMMTASDNRVTARLTKRMTQIKNLDSTSIRGERNVGVAISLPQAKAMLKGFNFNNKAILGSILFKPYQVATATGVININGLVPLNDIACPQGATHISIKGAWAKVDFANSVSDIQYSNVMNLPIDATSNNIILTPTAPPIGTGTDLFMLQIEFLQEVNSVQYSLKNGAYNALSIVEIN
jgi:hypothetical protein